MAATDTGNSGLLALVAATLALPGLTAIAADDNVRSEDYLLTYTKGHYAESGERMSVRVDSMTLVMPIGDRLQLKASGVRDVVSGASVIGNALIDGKPTQIRTGASIRDQREVIGVGAGYFGNNYFAGLDIGRSIENDYLARFVNVRYRQFFNDKLTALLIGAGQSNDLVWEKNYPSAQSLEDKQRRRQQELSLGVTQVLDENSVAQIILTHRYSSGFLDSQYRRAIVMNGLIPSLQPDSRPGNHRQWTVLTRYSRYFPSSRSAAHLDYRVGVDSWGADSHMVEGRWRFSLGDGWIASPGIRYYTQKNASFYDVVFTGMPANRQMSSDYRLAAFGALSLKAEIVKKVGDQFSFVLSLEQYSRKRSYALTEGRGSDIDDFRSRLVSLSIECAF